MLFVLIQDLKKRKDNIPAVWQNLKIIKILKLKFRLSNAVGQNLNLNSISYILIH